MRIDSDQQQVLNMFRNHITSQVTDNIMNINNIHYGRFWLKKVMGPSFLIFSY